MPTAGSATSRCCACAHLTATQQQSQRTASEPMFGGLPESLAMEMVANGLFHSGEQPDVVLARTRML
jgi:hypothetical protein